MTKMKEYSVDIIVPIYNVEKYVNRCIDSLLGQTYKQINIILVDDGSKDNSGHICDEYKKENNNIMVVHKENGGLVSAWIEGLKNSKSEFVNFVDGDDWIEPKHIENLVNEQTINDVDIVVIQFKQIDDNNSYIIPFEIPFGCYKGNKLKNTIYPIMINAGGFEKRGIPFSRCGKLIRKKLIEQNLKYEYKNATYEEDFNIIAPTLFDANGISLIRDNGGAYCYRRINNSMLHGYNKNMEESVEHVFDNIYNAVNDKNKEFFIPQLEAEYLSAKIRQTTNELRNPKQEAIKINIIKIASNKNLQKIIKKNYQNKYPLKFKIIVYLLKNYNNIKGKIMLNIMIGINHIRYEYKT